MGDPMEKLFKDFKGDEEDHKINIDWNERCRDVKELGDKISALEKKVDRIEKRLKNMLTTKELAEELSNRYGAEI